MLGTTLLSIQAQGQRKTTLQTDIITMTLQSKAPSKIGNETFYGNDGEGAVTFPSMEVLFGRKGTNLRSVGTQVSCRENFYILSILPIFFTSCCLSISRYFRPCKLALSIGNIRITLGLTIFNNFVFYDGLKTFPCQAIRRSNTLKLRSLLWS